MTSEELMNIAREARKNAISTMTSCNVGAALLCKNGKVYLGVNIEDEDSCSLSECAERVAMSSAIANNERDFVAIAVCGILKGREFEEMSPCGSCRQFLLEYAPNINVIFMHEGKMIEKNIKELMPYSYSFEENNNKN